ncbi:MAG: hypothetical protein AAFZ52_12335 [Bacteroidota bacterium]
MWKNLKGLFVVEEEGKKKTAPAKPSPAPKKPSPAPAAAPSTPSVSVSGNVNDRFVKVLLEAMEKANQPGFDYLEYKKALQNLKRMNFTDAVRFQTAYATAQSMGVTPKALMDSAQHYLTVLGEEEKKFAAALKGQRAQQVGDRENQLKSLDASIKQQEEQIKALQEKIAKTKAEQKKLRDSMNKSTAKLTKTQADFEETYAVITGGIREDVTKMQEFLK